MPWLPEYDSQGRRLRGGLYEDPPTRYVPPYVPTYVPPKECIWATAVIMGLLFIGYLVVVLALTAMAMSNRVYYQFTGQYCDSSPYRFITIQLNYYDGLCLMPNSDYLYVYNSSTTCYGWSDTSYWQNVSTITGDNSVTSDASYAANQRPLNALAVFFTIIPVLSLLLIFVSRCVSEEATGRLLLFCVPISYGAYVGVLLIYSMWASRVWTTLTQNHIWARYYDCETISGQGKESLILAIVCMTFVACVLGLCGCCGIMKGQLRNNVF